jgi:hypothetical protein
MIKFFRKIFTSFFLKFEQGQIDSVQKSVFFNALNKRKNLRIKYPHFGAFGPYPHVFYRDSEVIVSNISVGGLLVIDDTERFGQSVGEIVMITLAWPDFQTKVRTCVVGVNQHRRHLQFVDFNAQAFLRITSLTKAAYIGTRFHRVRDEVGQLQALELWIGPTSESLAFYNVGPFAELAINGEKFSFRRDGKTTSSNSERISKVVLYDVVVMLSNFSGQTDRVKQLIEKLQTEIKNLDRMPSTGTNG